MRSLLLLCVLLVLSCESPDFPGRQLQWAEIPGIYEATFEMHGDHSLVLKADSTYEHHYRAPDSQLYVDTGAWEFQVREQGFYSIHLYQYVWRHPERGWRNLSQEMIDFFMSNSNKPLNAVKADTEIRLEFDSVSRVYRKKRILLTD